MTVNSGRCDDALLRIVLRQEHVAREQIVPGELVDDANRQAIRRIGSGPGIEDVEFLVLEVRHHVAMERVELRLVHRTIDGPPVHVLFTGGFLDHELVVR